MGKAFRKELAALDGTYAWARAIPLGPLEQFAGVARARPMLAVGSGGSATAAHLAAMLHRRSAAAFARHATPLDVLLTESNLSEAAVLLLSASGRNRDVLATLERCVAGGAHAVATICTRRGSPLATAARRFERAFVFEGDVPCGKDGFLATNSLLATCVLVARVYGYTLPERIATHVPPSDIAGRATAVILHGGWGGPVATDLESKLNESAIASGQICDYRNFGHGRHLWLARRTSETFVVSLVTPETSEIASRTRALIPRSVPVVELRTSEDGPTATLDLLVRGFHLVGHLGERQNFDPGRPKVPEFGRKLYRLAPSPSATTSTPAVSRKLARTMTLAPADEDAVAVALRAFFDRLGTVCLGGVVLDYDGTICGRAERLGTLRKDVAAECRRLLDAGVILGIATGRGRSARTALQKSLPRSSWSRVVIGYYNGSDVAPLSDDGVPDRDAPTEPPLQAARDLLARDPLLRGLVTVETRRRQITVEPTSRMSMEALVSRVAEILGSLEQTGLRVSTSAHSVDVVAPGVGKLAVVEEVRRRIPEDTEILCIGDRGRWPGNDCALLSHVPSLSVDEVSASLDTCWNLAPAGVIGPDAAVLYLRATNAADGRATFDTKAFAGRR